MQIALLIQLILLKMRNNIDNSLDLLQVLNLVAKNQKTRHK